MKKLLGAYYYPWYGKPRHATIGGGEWTYGYSFTPALGEYSCEKDEVIQTHIEWLKKAGIDFICFNWIGPETWDDIVIKKKILPKLADTGLKFCMFYDSIPALNKVDGAYQSYDFNEPYVITKKKGEKFVDDFLAMSGFPNHEYLFQPL